MHEKCQILVGYKDPRPYDPRFCDLYFKFASALLSDEISNRLWYIGEFVRERQMRSTKAKYKSCLTISYVWLKRS